MVWPADLSLKLAAMYRESPALWNPGHPDFKNRIIRNVLTSKIAKELGCTTTEVDKKFRNLRAQFRREHIRTMNGLKSCWFAYDSMKFILNISKKDSDGNQANTSTDDTDYDDMSQIEFVSAEDATCRTKEVVVNDDGSFRLINGGEILSDTWNQPTTEIPRGTAKKAKMDFSTNEFHSYHQPADEFSSFADCVAHKLRSINNPRARSVAQYVINSVLFQAEMTNYYENFEHIEPQEIMIFRKSDSTEKE